MNEPLFSELDVTDLKHFLIFLDIDGTLTADGQSEFNPQCKQKMKELSENNRVVFCSNKRGIHSRDSALVDFGDISCLQIPYRKPNRKILNFVQRIPEHALLVIGDKFITDGLFAHNIGARFIKVGRVTSDADSFNTIAGYWIDNLAYALTKRFFHGIF